MGDTHCLNYVPGSTHIVHAPDWYDKISGGEKQRSCTGEFPSPEELDFCRKSEYVIVYQQACSTYQRKHVALSM